MTSTKIIIALIFILFFMVFGFLWYFNNHIKVNIDNNILSWNRVGWAAEYSIHYANSVGSSKSEYYEVNNEDFENILRMCDGVKFSINAYDWTPKSPPIASGHIVKISPHKNKSFSNELNIQLKENILTWNKFDWVTDYRVQILRPNDCGVIVSTSLQDELLDLSPYTIEWGFIVNIRWDIVQNYQSRNLINTFFKF